MASSWGPLSIIDIALAVLASSSSAELAPAFWTAIEGLANALVLNEPAAKSKWNAIMPLVAKLKMSRYLFWDSSIMPYKYSLLAGCSSLSDNSQCEP